jgi:3-methylcrotonyl-CoA carboxylase alpha subunit
MIRRLLVANRGEIALRIIRTCREAGIESVAVYSDADAQAPHALAADYAVRLGPAPASESYLSVGKIIDAARASGADAVHPGYGFLSENPALAGACADAKLVFVGPPAEVIARMGSKIGARHLMERAGVPVVPGATPADQSDLAIIATIERVGLPALVKASAGGGGKGMRIIRAIEEAHDAVPSARREAHAAFGDDTLYVERLIERPRHVEVQVFADAEGRVVHLFERECSVQRRHQKIVEESPSPILTPALRARMGEAAVAAARAAGYRNAGTIEFLVEGTGDAASFFFLEMNTRLQVEHAVTEAVVGVDLVRAQLAVAGGAPLPWTQDALAQRGHAIECRVYAEDPAADFLPQAGRILLYREPSGPGIRVDSGIAERSEVTVHYDPLVAKLIAHGEHRAAAHTRSSASVPTSRS